MLHSQSTVEAIDSNRYPMVVIEQARPPGLILVPPALLQPGHRTGRKALGPGGQRLLEPPASPRWRCLSETARGSPPPVSPSPDVWRNQRRAKGDRLPRATPDLGHVHRHRPDPLLNLPLRVVTVADNHGLALVIPLGGLRGSKLRDLWGERLRNPLPSASLHHLRQRVSGSSIFRLRFDTLTHRAVSLLGLKVDVGQYPLPSETPRLFNSRQTPLSNRALVQQRTGLPFPGNG